MAEDRILTDYLTEQEQIEILKKWIKEYSVVIISGILIAGITVTGWRYWQDRQAKILNHASAVYNEMLAMRAQNNPTATLVQAKKLFRHYPKTPYGQMAGLMLARESAAKNQYKEAMKTLTWVLDHSRTPAIKQIARIRLARIMIADKQYQSAINTLQKVDDQYFKGLIDEVTGDAYLSMKNIDMARVNYQKALSEIPNAEIVRPLLQMKYDNLTTIKA